MGPGPEWGLAPLWKTLDGGAARRYSSDGTDSGLPPPLLLAVRGALSVSWQVALTFRPFAVLHRNFRLISLVSREA